MSTSSWYHTTLSSRTKQPTSTMEDSTQADVTSQSESDVDLAASDILVARHGAGTESDPSEIAQTYMSVVWNAGRLGAAYYDVETTQICMMPDAVETDNFQLLKKLMYQVQPVHVAVSSKQDDRFLEVLQNFDQGEEEHPQFLCLLPSLDFWLTGLMIGGLASLFVTALDICKRRILCLDLPCIPNSHTESEKTLFLSSLVPFEHVNMIRAIGGLLKFLDKKRIGVELEDAEVRVPVLALKMFSLLKKLLIAGVENVAIDRHNHSSPLLPVASQQDMVVDHGAKPIIDVGFPPWSTTTDYKPDMDDFMVVDDNTYNALQIFSRESHPSVYKAALANSGKEGLSLFGVMNRCRSHIGTKMLRMWFLRPLCNMKILQDRLEAVTFFCNPRHVEVTSTLQGCLKQIKNINRTLTRMAQAETSFEDWQSLYKTFYNAIYISDVCRAQTVELDIFTKIKEHFTEDLLRIAGLINKIVDFEESVAQSRFVVKPNVDPALDKKKRTFNGLPDFMTKVARDELDKLAEVITECNVTYLPQLGYMLVISVTEVMKQSKDYTLPGLDFVFISNEKVHYKSESTKELDRLLGDTRWDITDLETGIMHKLQNTILEHSKVLLDVMQYAAELDCLLALAEVAREGNYSRPALTTANVIQIRQGRHPLQELCCTPFVPNDTFSGVDQARLKVLTGPNASGKSVYLKQVALVVFLAHVGSFVPAEAAEIGLIDGIYTRIRTTESVSAGLSTFMIDLNQVAVAVRCATARSLVILDEFGKGTDSTDGVALLAACLKHWLNHPNSCPHTIVSTHLHGIVRDRLLPESPLLKFMTMEFLEDDDELVFLYQLVEDSKGTSHALHTAKKAGLPPEILARAVEVTDLLRQNKPINRVDTASTETQYKRCQEIVAHFLELDLEKDDLEKFLENCVLSESQAPITL